MANISNNLTDLIGNTPLLELSRFSKNNNCKAKIIAKLEYFNPGGSVKDRIAYNMIKDAEEKGLIKEGSTIIEPTSGNTGIGLALVGAVKGYRVILIMPDSMSMERRKLLKAYGAEIVLTPGIQGMKAAIDKAEQLAEEIPNSFIPQQFANKANPEIHKKTTAKEIWNDTDGQVDFFVAGIGTGGTVTGTGQFLKEKNPDVKIIGIEPFNSPAITEGKSGPHKIQGIGAGFIPDILDVDILDEIIKVKNEDAYKVSRELTKTEGLLLGMSSGAAVYAAMEIAKREENKGKTIVVLLPDTGERYLSTDLYKE